MKVLMTLAPLIGLPSSSAFFAATRIIQRASHQNLFSGSLFRDKLFSSTSPGPSMPAKRVLVPIADDSEEIETTCITDTLTRFGAEVVVASVKPGGELVCKMSRGVKIMADIPIDAANGQDWDLVALPGGMPGSEHLRDSGPLTSILEAQKSSGKAYAAICAAPAVVLAAKGMVAEGATCYPAPGLLEKMPSPSTGGDAVVVQGNVVTSQGPGTALKFAVALGEMLFGPEKAKVIADEMLV